MTDKIDQLLKKMEAAALALDFDEAQRCRDQIDLIRRGEAAAKAEHENTSRAQRQ